MQVPLLPCAAPPPFAAPAMAAGVPIAAPAAFSTLCFGGPPDGSVYFLLPLAIPAEKSQVLLPGEPVD